jgi:hypothetical protein
MPDLEQSIAEWRKQMRAAGIKDAAPLDELENHLREDMEREMKAGANEREAFTRAAARLGSAETLREEFAKVELSAGEQPVNRLLSAGLMVTYALLGMVWLLKTSTGPLNWLLGASGLALFPVIWSWRFTYRWLPMIPVSAIGKRVGLWLLAGMLGFLCTAALVQFIPADANGGIDSRYLGVFVWAWLPAVIGLSSIIGLERRRLARN